MRCLSGANPPNRAETPLASIARLAQLLYHHAKICSCFFCQKATVPAWTSEPLTPKQTTPIFVKITYIIVATILNIVAPIILIVFPPTISNLVRLNWHNDIYQSLCSSRGARRKTGEVVEIYKSESAVATHNAIATVKRESAKRGCMRGELLQCAKVKGISAGRSVMYF